MYSSSIISLQVCLQGRSGYTILFYTMIYYDILYYIILYFTVLYYSILYYSILYYTILCYDILYFTTLNYIILWYTILCYDILWWWWSIAVLTILYVYHYPTTVRLMSTRSCSRDAQARNSWNSYRIMHRKYIGKHCNNTTIVVMKIYYYYHHYHQHHHTQHQHHHTQHQHHHTDTHTHHHYMVISTIPVGLELFLSRWDETVDQIHKSLSIEPNTRWWLGFYDWG